MPSLTHFSWWPSAMPQNTLIYMVMGGNLICMTQAGSVKAGSVKATALLAFKSIAFWQPLSKFQFTT